MRIIIVGLLLFSLKIGFCQKEYNMLVSTSDTTKKVKIKSIKSLWFEDTIRYKDDMFMYGAPYERKIHSGLWEFSLYQDSLNNFWVNDYSVYGTCIEWCERPIQTKLYTIDAVDGDAFGEDFFYYTRDITAITLRNRLKPWMRAGAWIGLASSLVISPLVAYNFKDRQMNSGRYNRWMFYSITSMTTFFTINLFLKDKTYRIKPPYEGEKWKFSYQK